MDCAVSAYINYLRIAGRANPALLAGSGNSDARHTDKLFFANRTFIAALIAIKVLINIAPISMHRFAAALADIHIAALCTAYGTMVLLFSTAADAAGYGAYRHLAIVVFAFQQRCNRVSILIVGIVVPSHIRSWQTARPQNAAGCRRSRRAACLRTTARYT